MRSLWRTIPAQTLRDIGLVCLADALVAVSFGATAVSGGLRWWVPILMSVVIFAGGAQFAAVGIVLGGGGAVAAVTAGAVLNTRLLPYGFAVADLVGGKWWRRLIGAHLVTDETVAFALRADDHAGRRSVFWACGLGLFGVWNAAVVLGVGVGALVRNTAAFGLDAAFPAVILALAVPALADRPTRNAALAGGAVAVGLTPVLSPGLPVLVGLCGLLVAVPALIRDTPVRTSDEPVLTNDEEA